MPQKQPQKKLATGSADELLRAFKVKVTGNILWAGGLTELVLSIAQFLLGNYAQAGAILFAGIFFTAMAWFYHGQRIPIPVRVMFIGLLTVISVISIHENQTLGVYWTYPLLVACFFLFSGVLGIIAASSLTVIFGITSIYVMPTDDGWRIAVTLGIICVLGSVYVVLLSELQKILRKLVVTDTLTGLQNRHLVTAVLEDALHRFRRYKRPATVIMADLDHFKKINDTFGHLFGDQILKQVAERLQSVLRQSDQLFRVGGEEFLVVLPETTATDAHAVAQKLRALIAEHSFNGKDAKTDITISLGVAQLLEEQTWPEWLSAADNALLAAKQNGRNRVEVAQ
ncbi:Response regulator PleD [Pseudidiomarina piscicola]|uniref:diguanylate cyclase n=1 Tax=Pseudidiomarina piscicola TaxID=2614830 RepID=A0A6S6WJH5_9GAMM|nr:GGDEF domain-containing protein [Pseudidiomarina piscicola]CAB0150803.1 Response regulator PleD [Pseudidiomarina piscicola]VZT40308.1 Response regulator PleD [Pseudomonas aeruginosa]